MVMKEVRIVEKIVLNIGLCEFFYSGYFFLCIVCIYEILNKVLMFED